MSARSLPLVLLLVAAASRQPPVSRGPCPPLDSTAAWARVERAWSREGDGRWSNDSLRRVLLALRDSDQAMRSDYAARAGDSTYGVRLIARDSSLALSMAGILDRFGLPTRDLVGAAGADAAMLIVQHNWSLQERVLALSHQLPPGQLSAQALAMLEDRVRVHQGKPQRFGTQFTLGPDGLFRFAPTSDLAGLDARRARAGMMPLKQYVCLLEESGIKVDRASLPAHGTNQLSRSLGSFVLRYLFQAETIGAVRASDVE